MQALVRAEVGETSTLALLFEGATKHQAVVIDTNVILDMCLFADPRVHALRQKIEDKSLTWLATLAMREELIRVLSYPHLVARAELRDLALREPLGTSGKDILLWFDASVLLCETAPKARYVCKDPGDQKFVDLAAQKTAMLISKDKAVLALTHRLARLGVQVCNTQKLPFE